MALTGFAAGVFLLLGVQAAVWTWASFSVPLSLETLRAGALGAVVATFTLLAIASSCFTLIKWPFRDFERYEPILVRARRFGIHCTAAALVCAVVWWILMLIQAVTVSRRCSEY
jgi:hypothetical protein